MNESEREGISVQKLSMSMSIYFLEKGWKIHQISGYQKTRQSLITVKNTSNLVRHQIHLHSESDEKNEEYDDEKYLITT